MNAYNARLFGQLASKVSTRVISPVSARYALGHGFNVENVNPLGHVQPWSIQSLVNFSYGLHYSSVFHNKGFLDLDKIGSHTIFIAGNDIDIKRCMYDHRWDKRSCDIQITLSEIGMTSFSLKFDVFIPDIEASVATGMTKNVFIDLNSYKPSPLPEWWREKYSKLVAIEKTSQPFIVQSASRPTESKLCSLRTSVTPTDIDGSLHMGWQFYARMFLNSHVQWRHKHLDSLGNGGAYRDVKYLKTLYVKEAFLGEEMVIDSYSVHDNNNEFLFFMENKKGRVSECFVEFYPNHLPQD